MSQEYGILLPCGSRIVHGAASDVRPAFPPATAIPGTLHLFSAGHAAAPAATPAFRGAMGYFPFDTSMRMPRHVHMTSGTGGEAQRFVVEKVLTVSGVGLVELAGRVYVVPPLTMVLIAPGVPHTWTACPAGVDLVGLGVAEEGEGGAGEGGGGGLVSEGVFAAVFEYEDATAFYPTAQTVRLESVEEYVAEDDLHAIRFPELSAQEVVEKSWFLWGRSVRMLTK